LKKFDIEEYTAHRIREIRGSKQPLRSPCPITEVYTSKRIRELRGETVYWNTEQDKTIAYCILRIQEHRLEHQLRERKLLLDNRRLGSYTVVTMGDHDGES
jgi:hypothetical protein